MRRLTVGLLVTAICLFLIGLFLSAWLARLTARPDLEEQAAGAHQDGRHDDDRL